MTLSVSAAVVRPGRTVLLRPGVAARRVRATGRGAPATAWLFPTAQDGAGPPDRPRVTRPPTGPSVHARRAGAAGYLDAVEWRWIAGGLDAPGTGVVWMRPAPLVEGEETSPLQRLLACVDSASGVSAMLDVREWAFLNTELTVHVLREPVGEWICLDAATTLGPGSVGVATSTAYDEQRPGRALGPGAAGAAALSTAEPQRSISTLPTVPASTASWAAAVSASGKRVSGRPCSSPTPSTPAAAAAVTSSAAAWSAASPTV